MRRLSIRWRLTLWYGAVLSAILIAFSTGVYLLMRHHLLSLTDAALAEELSDLGGDVGRCRSTAEIPRELALRYSSHEGYEFQVSTLRGEPLFRSDRIEAAGLSLPRPKSSSESSSYTTLTLRRLGHVRTVGRVVSGPAGPMVIRAAVSLTATDHALRGLLAVLLSIGPLALAATLGGGYVLARKALAPVDRMVTTAAEITATRLDRRVDAPNAQDELGRLASTLNDMIARLQRSFEEVRRFTADAAHELRTPLSMMRTEAEVALRSPREPEPDGRVLENILEETDRLGRLVSQLLFLCREDTGLATGARGPVRLDDVVREVADHMQVMAREKGLILAVDGITPCCVQGDADRLRQLFFNLLDNAIKNTPSGGAVTVQRGAPNGRVRVVIADTGVGIPAEHLPYVFDRFYRVDPSRSRETEGAGLGLAICRAIAEAHGGQIQIESAVGEGTRVTLTLPARPPVFGPLEEPGGADPTRVVHLEPESPIIHKRETCRVRIVNQPP
jgi:two-component system heavy metal sensor histidine kinase CusS